MSANNGRCCPCCGIHDPDAEPGARFNVTGIQSEHAWVRIELNDAEISQLASGMFRIAVVPVEADAPDAPQERDDAVKWLRLLMEETVAAGYPAGDRRQTIANVRAMAADLRAFRAANPNMNGVAITVPPPGRKNTE